MRKALLGIFSALMLTGCLGFPGVYKQEIPQGNVVTQEQVDQLRPGMTPSQVRYVLGTPLVQDTFDAQRWDYMYTVQHDGQYLTYKRLSVEFSDGRLSGLSGDFRPQQPQE